ncbi:MAG TPA: FimV/HubP family polar landmark protein, partial [Pseudoxanthomonas sp.]|nr:FimV/HubP family polar landmark protein [Pseudoxanthomonas sp.]
MNINFLKRLLVASTALALMLTSAAAAALGLGEIRVKSKPGQPLVAEIPIISTEPGELEQLQARLASPITFERVGLPRPSGLVSELDFTITMSDDGRAVIRVTSNEPVQVAAVNFLIEVNWGQGRLVREYSALVDAPGTLAAGDEPAIEAPLPPPSNAIIREPEAIAVAPSLPEPTLEAESAPEAAPRTRATPAPAAATQIPSAAALQAAAGDGIQVRRGQTLSQIARDLGQGYSLDQTMIALLRANPEAFIRGNVNLLKAGAVLRVPPDSELARLQQGEAAALVREQTAQWRQARQPIPQPVDAAPSPAAGPSDNAAQAQGPQVAQARLEIVPPAADAATRAGTQSGIDAQGEGDMLANQELTATREDLAARESEVQELRAQVAELESLQQRQAQLIALKDSELAAAQQQLAAGQGGGQPLWLWAGLVLLALGLAVAWLMSRRRPETPLVRSYDATATASAASAASAVPATVGSQVEPEVEDRWAQDRWAQDEAVAFERAIAAAPSEAPPQPVPVPPPATPARASTSALPEWKAAVTNPTWHTGEDGISVALNFAPAGRERLALAIAYMDLGEIQR